MVYMYHSFLVHSSADGHLGCFHVDKVLLKHTHTILFLHYPWLPLCYQGRSSFCKNLCLVSKATNSYYTLLYRKRLLTTNNFFKLSHNFSNGSKLLWRYIHTRTLITGKKIPYYFHQWLIDYRIQFHTQLK